MCGPLRYLHFLLLPFVLSVPSASLAAESVRAELGTESAWVGQAVPLIVTLYSPGPFSGTAAFDLPDLPQTAFVKSGNPVVGSEEVDDETYFTQRHEFTLYTQRAGEMVLPPFRVRFSGKKSFISDAEPMEGLTPELRFRSNRPPGTESMGLVISATTMETRQTWNPEPSGKINAGDVIVRTITRVAEGTTAMMLPPVSAEAPEGVQIYAGTCEVEDKVERGDASAQRLDTIKYQFQRAGTSTLPELSFAWWNPQREQLESATLPGVTIEVMEAVASDLPAADASRESSSVPMVAFVGLLALALSLWFLRKPLGRLIAAWLTYHNRPEAVAARRLRAACNSGEAAAAYAALMAWQVARKPADHGRGMDSLLGREENRELRAQWEALSRHLFDPSAAAAAWHGRPLWVAFSRARSLRNRRSLRVQAPALPALNPTRSTSESVP